MIETTEDYFFNRRPSKEFAAHWLPSLLFFKEPKLSTTGQISPGKDDSQRKDTRVGYVEEERNPRGVHPIGFFMGSFNQSIEI